MALVDLLQISNRIAYLRRYVHPTPGRRKGVHLYADSLSVVETTRTWVAPREACNSCLTRQIVQSDFSTSQGSFLKPDMSCVKFPKPSFAPCVLHIEYKSVPRLQQRAFVSLSVATIPTMLHKKIQIEEVLYSAKVISADVECLA